MAIGFFSYTATRATEKSREIPFFGRLLVLTGNLSRFTSDSKFHSEGPKESKAGSGQTELHSSLLSFLPDSQCA